MGVREWKILAMGLAGTLVASILLVLVAMMGAEIAVEHRVADVRVGAPAPNIEQKSEDHGDIDLEEYRGKVVLLNFWATWCPPCLEEMPLFNDLQARFGDQGFQIITVNTDRSRSALKDFLKANDLQFPVIHDRDRTLTMRFAVDSYPTTFLIDKKGVIVRSGHVMDFEAEILKLL